MKKLFIFDMDGTLLINTTSNLELAKVTKTQKLLEDLELKYKNADIGFAITTQLFGVAVHSKR